MATIVTDAGAVDVDGRVATGTLIVELAELGRATGWELEPDGLCRAGVCIPTRARPEVRVGDSVDLNVVADLLGRPFALDEETAVAVLGESAAVSAAQLASAPLDGLVLADADGHPIQWSSLGRKKKVLVAWASW